MENELLAIQFAEWIRLNNFSLLVLSNKNTWRKYEEHKQTSYTTQELFELFQSTLMI